MCDTVLLLLAFLGIFAVLKGYSHKLNEGFLSPGGFPNSVDKILLEHPHGDRVKRSVVQLTEKNAENIFALYPKTAIKSYAQLTNNQKYPISVCNGRAVPASFCGAFYNPKNANKYPLRRPCENKRVNFYNY